MATAPRTAPVAAEPPPPPAETVDEFTAAFANFSKEDAPVIPAVTQVPADPPPVVVARTPDPAPPAPEPTVTEPVTELEHVEDVKPNQGGKPPAAPAPAPAIGGPDGGERPGGQQQGDQIERLIEALTTRTAPPAVPGRPAAAQPPLYSEPEIAALTEFAKEWPDVARAQEILLRGTSQVVMQRVFQEIAAAIGPKLALLDQMATNMQYDDVQRRVPDYEAVIPKVEAWVKEAKLPAYLKTAYSGVIEGGSPEEIADLIGRYRQDTGDTTGTIAQPPAPPPAPAPPAPSLSSAAIKAAARLAPVDGNRSGPIQGAPQTFDDGFAAALKSLA